MNKTLLIMAAGMGSRFGGGKQTAELGPNGEMLMEYSIYDAMQAGFDKIVFIISPAMAEFFPELIKKRIKCRNVEFAVQSFESLPEWFAVPEGRTKPYGTVHAVLAAKDLIDSPFAVLNADDFYGRQAFSDISAAIDGIAGQGEACMLTYRLASTLSGTGGVTRGICRIAEDGTLAELCETRGIQLDENKNAFVMLESGEKKILDNDLPASMNFFGFMPWMMQAMEQGFEQFLREITPESAEKAEYPIPVLMDKMITGGQLKMKVVHTNSPWFGVTYREDAPLVLEELKKLAPEYNF